MNKCSPEQPDPPRTFPLWSNPESAKSQSRVYSCSLGTGRASIPALTKAPVISRGSDLPLESDLLWEDPGVRL